jgi:hypothetical protein
VEGHPALRLTRAAIAVAGLALAGCGSGDRTLQAARSIPTTTSSALTTSTSTTTTTIAALKAATTVTTAARATTSTRAPSPDTTAGQSGVQGMVTAGPTCPVQRTDDTTCADKPVPADITVRSRATGATVATGAAGQDGRFRIAVAPGDYAVEAQSPQAMRCQPADVTVPRGRYTDVAVSCDTGIR